MSFFKQIVGKDTTSTDVKVTKTADGWEMPYTEKTKILLDNEWLLNMNNHFLSNVSVETQKQFHSPLLAKFIEVDMRKIKPMYQKLKSNDLGWSMYSVELINEDGYYKLFLNDLKHVDGDVLEFPKVYNDFVVDDVQINPIDPLANPYLVKTANKTKGEGMFLAGKYAKEFLRYDEDTDPNDGVPVKVYFTFITHTFSIKTGSYKLNKDVLTVNNKQFKIVNTEFISKRHPEKFKEVEQLKVYPFMLTDFEKTKYIPSTYKQTFYIIDSYLYDIPSILNNNRALEYVNTVKNTRYPIVKVTANVTVYSKVDLGDIVGYEATFNKPITIFEEDSEDNTNKKLVTIKKGLFMKYTNFNKIGVQINSKANDYDTYRILTCELPQVLTHNDEGLLVHKFTYIYKANMFILYDEQTNSTIVIIINYIGKTIENKVFNLKNRVDDDWLVLQKNMDIVDLNDYSVKQKLRNKKLYVSPTSEELYIYVGVGENRNTIKVTEEIAEEDEEVEEEIVKEFEYKPYFYNLQSFIRPNFFSSTNLSYYHAFLIGNKIKIQWKYFGTPIDPSQEISKLNFNFKKTSSHLYTLLQILKLDEDISSLIPIPELTMETITEVNKSQMNPKHITTFSSNEEEQALKFMPDEWEMLVQTCIRGHSSLPYKLFQDVSRFVDVSLRKPYIDMYAEKDWKNIQKAIMDIYVDSSVSE